MEADQAVKFIERMFSHAASDRMAILAIPRSEGKAEQRVFTLPQATSRKVQGWLRHLNARDYDIYLCVNPVRPGSMGREKGDIEDYDRHTYMSREYAVLLQLGRCRGGCGT